jgi:hypothetical protein
MEWIDAQERTATLGCQLFGGLKAAQQQQSPEVTDLGSPATKKFACRTVLAYECACAGRRLRHEQDRAREGREFVERVHKLESPFSALIRLSLPLVAGFSRPNTLLQMKSG